MSVVSDISLSRNENDNLQSERSLARHDEFLSQSSKSSIFTTNMSFTPKHDEGGWYRKH